MSNLFRKFCGVNTLALWIVIIFSSYSQKHITKNQSITDGLANNSVRSLYLDSRGLLWIGTENGISVKRHTEFLNFFMEDGLAYNSCWAITEDTQGQMWFGSYGGGVSMFDGKNFHKITEDLYTPFIRTLFAWGDYIWVGTTNGLNLVNIYTLEVTKVQDTQGPEELSFISGFFTFGKRIFYATYRNGIYEVIKKNGTYTAHKINSLEYIYAIEQDEDKVYISGKEQLLLFSSESLISSAPTPSWVKESSNFYSFQKTNSHGLLGAATGLYSPNGGVFKLDEEIESLNDPFDLSSRNFWSMAYHEPSSTLYLGSLDKGLYEVNLSNKFLLIETKGLEILGFEGENQLEVVLRSDGLYFMDEKKLIPKHTFKSTQQRYFAKSSSWIPLHEDDFYELNPTLSTDELIFYGITYNQESFWINSNIGIFQLSRSGEILTYLPLHSLVIGFTPEGKLIESNPYGGMRIYTDLNNPSQYEYFPDYIPENPDMLSQIETKGGKTYFSSVFAGLFRLDHRGFYSFLTSGRWGVDKIKSIYPASDNQLVVGGEFGDVYLLEDGDDFTELLKLTKSSIYGNSIIGVLAYQDAILIITEQGVNIYTDGSVKLLDEEQGLRKSIIKSYKLLGDNLYIGYEDAYLQIHLPLILNLSYKYYDLKITKLQVNFKPIESESLYWFTYQPKTITLKDSPSSLLIQVQPHRLLYPEKLQYRYRVNPDQEWTPFSTNNEIFLSNLNYGKYTLEIEVFDLHSGKSEFFRLAAIEVLSPFYLKTWFLLLMLCIISLILVILYNLRIDQIKEKELIERKVSETKMEALRSQMNPHFIFNAINSIQYYILKNENDKAIDYLGKFSTLIRKTLENSKASRITLAREIDYLKAYLSVESERVNNRISWEIKTTKNIDLEFDLIPPMLIQPMIENAIVHAFPMHISNPSIQVVFDKSDDGNILCEISDNGIGINNRQNKSHRSRGLELLVERISLLPNAKEDSVSITSEAGKGTTILLKIPIHF